MIIPVRYLTRPSTSSLTDITMTVYTETNSLVGVYNMVEVGGTGIYGLNVDLVSSTYHWAIIECPTLNLRDVIRLTPSSVTVSADVSFLSEAETGTWKRVGSILNYYDSNMVLIAQYELQDDTNTATADPTAVANRIRIGP